MKKYWGEIKNLLLVVVIIVAIDYLLQKIGLPITFNDLLFLTLGLVGHGVVIFIVKEYFFEYPKNRNKIFLELDEPFWKLLLYAIFTLALLLVGILISHEGLTNLLGIFYNKGIHHGYSLALFGSGFTLLMVLLNMVVFRSIFVKIKNK